MYIIHYFIRYIVNILNEIPFPPPGKYEISISTSEKTLYFSQPPKNEIPLINNVNYHKIVFTYNFLFLFLILLF